MRSVVLRARCPTAPLRGYFAYDWVPADADLNMTVEVHGYDDRVGYKAPQRRLGDRRGRHRVGGGHVRLVLAYGSRRS